jgi:acyl-CoA thioester hydrolase
MPHTQPLTIQHYDCDAYGHLRTSAYLSLLEESDRAAMTSGGFLPGEAALGWSPRLISVEFFTPLLPGTPVQVHTRLAGCDGQFSRREYAIQAGNEPTPACLAALDWGLYDLEAGAFTPIPDEVSVKLKQGLELDNLPGETPFPSLANPPSGALTLDWQVTWGETIQAYRLSNRALMDRLIESGLQSGIRYQWTLQEAQEQGVVFVARKLWMELLRPAAHGEQLRTTTWLAELRRSTVMRQYVVRRVADGQIAALAQTLWVYLDLRAGRPIRIPPEFADAWRDHLAM